MQANVTNGVLERLEPRILARPEHGLSRKNISAEALKVLYRLNRSGYLAYLVGGGVRDLLLGKSPKDYDIATNARPQEIRRLFRNSRIIGRRFRLVHVFFKNEIVEVATFRASPEAPEGPDDWHEAEQEAMEEAAEELVRPISVDEAVYGTPDEDAKRRDFTVNALFYDIDGFSVIDYVGGIEDLEAKVIRTIGDPDVRFAEDPVRIMRALEYGVRLGFRLDEAVLDAIDRGRELIGEASGARLTYELLESLRSGSAAGICGAWRNAGIFQLAFPGVECMNPATETILRTVDTEIRNGRPFHDSTLIGSLFLVRFFDLLGSMTDGAGRVDNVEFLNRLAAMLEPATTSLHLSNHSVHLIHHGLFTMTKLRLPPERGRQVLKLSRQEFFPVAWGLYSLAASAGLLDTDVYGAWSRALDRVRQGELEDAVSDERSARPRRRRPRGRRRR
jgi:poly(A) polymerase